MVSKNFIRITIYRSHVLLAHISSMYMQKSICRQAMVCPSPQRPTGSGTIRNIAPGRHAELTKSSRHAPQLVSDLSTRTSSLQKQSSIDGRTVAAVNQQHPKARQDRRTQICCIIVRNKSVPSAIRREVLAWPRAPRFLARGSSRLGSRAAATAHTPSASGKLRRGLCKEVKCTTYDFTTSFQLY